MQSPMRLCLLAIAVTLLALTSPASCLEDDFEDAEIEDAVDDFADAPSEDINIPKIERVCGLDRTDLLVAVAMLCKGLLHW